MRIQSSSCMSITYIRPILIVILNHVLVFCTLTTRLAPCWFGSRVVSKRGGKKGNVKIRDNGHQDYYTVIAVTVGVLVGPRFVVLQHRLKGKVPCGWRMDFVFFVIWIPEEICASKDINLWKNILYTHQNSANDLLQLAREFCNKRGCRLHVNTIKKKNSKSYVRLLCSSSDTIYTYIFKDFCLGCEVFHPSGIWRHTVFTINL